MASVLFCLFLSFFSLASISGYSQVRPGGNATPFASMQNWFSADGRNCAGNGCLVDTIFPVVGSTVLKSFNGVGGTARYYERGTYTTSPVVSLDSAWFHFARDNDGQDFTIFIVASSGNSASGTGNWQTDPCILGVDNTTGGNNRVLGLTFDNGILEYSQGSGTSSELVTVPNSGNYLNVPLLVGIFRSDAAGGSDTDTLFVNDFKKTFASTNADMNEFTNYVLGSNKGNKSRNYLGEVSEGIIFDEMLTYAQMGAVQSYLGLKYGLPIGRDFLKLEGTGNVFHLDGTFESGIFGIARVDSSDLNVRLNQSALDTGLVAYLGTAVPSVTAGSYGPRQAQEPSGALTNDTYLVFGHNNKDTTFTRSFGGGSANKLGRTWKAVETGSVGPVTLWFKSSTYNQLSSSQDYFLAISKDSVIGVGEQFIPMTNVLGGNDFYAQVDFPANDSTYFTIVKDTLYPFISPGGVRRGMQLFLASDILQTAGSWKDLSGNGNDVTTTGGAIQALQDSLNYHTVYANAIPSRTWATASAFRGKVIFAVGKVTAGGTGNPGLWGFSTKGVRGTTAGVADGGQASPFSGTFRVNGNAAAATGDAKYFRMFTSNRGTVTSDNEQFYLGNFLSGGTVYPYYSFAEFIVYDTTLTVTQINQIESYLGIKYGLTLGHNYIASDGVTVVYNVLSSFAKDIFGIGRDSLGVLDQRQSAAFDSTGVVSISLGTHAAKHNDNVSTFDNDKQFLMMGSDADDAASRCWTSEIDVPGELGDHIRIRRQWQMVRTNWGATDSVQVRFWTNNPFYSMPLFPAESSDSVFMYLSTTNFNGAHTALAKQMQKIGTTDTFQVWLSNSDIMSYTFMTFGTRLDDATKVDSICAGDSIVFYRADLPALSNIKVKFLSESGILTDSVMLSSPTVDTSNVGCYTRVSFPAPVSLLADSTYAIGVDDCSVGCLTFSHPGNLPVTLDSIAIRPGEDGLITYLFPADSIFCANDDNLSPSYVPAANAFGPGFGTFSIQSTTGSASLPALIDTVVTSPTFGMIIVHPGNVGAHTLVMKSRPNLTCPDSTVFSYEIKPTVSTSVTYDNALYCGSVVTDTPDVAIGGAPVVLPIDGLFELFPPVPGGISATMGSVNGPSLPTFGSYIVTFRPSDSLCAADVSQALTFSQPTRAVFDYLDDEVCENSGTIGPFITTRPSGYFAIDTANSPGAPGNITLNPTNGFIDLNNTQPGTYYIQFLVTSGSCPYNAADTLIVSPKPDVTILTPDTVLCNNASFIKVLTNAGGGTFHSWDNSLTVSNDTISNNNVIGGPYDLYYTDTLGICVDSSSIGITIIGLQQADIEYPNPSYCQNAGTPLPTFISGTAGGEYLMAPPVVGGIDSASGMLTLSLMTPGVYNISYITPDSVCPDTNVVDVITVQTVNPATFNFPIDTVCRGLDTVFMNAAFPSPEYQFTVWKGNTNVTASFTVSTGATTRIRFNAGVPDSTITYIVRGIRTTGTCTDTAYADFTIVRNSIADIEFIPQIICFGDPDPYPFNYGDPNGVFTIVPPQTGSITVNDSTGVVYISASNSQDTSFTVIYTTPGSCSSFDSATVLLRPKLDASFHYFRDAICMGLDSLFLTAIEDSSQGIPSVYSCQDTGIVLNPLTGVIDLTTSQPGRYNVVREIQQTGACVDSDVFTITLDARDTTTRMYIDFNNNLSVMDTFCPSLDSIGVFLDGDSSGIFSSPSGLIYKNIDIGLISLRFSPTGVKHYVRYDLNNACGDSLLDSLYLINFENAGFDYGATSFCNGTSLYTPTTSTVGNFWIVAGSNAIGSLTFSDGVNGISQTGTLNLTGNSPTGSFTIYHETTGSCPGLDSVTVNVFSQPTNADIRVDPASSLCIGQTATIIPNGVANTYRFFLNDTTNFLQRTPSLTTSTLSDGDSIIVEFQSNNSCTLYKGVKFRVRPIPEDSIIGFSTILSAGDPIEIELMSLTDENLIVWSGEASSTYTLDSTLGFVPQLDSGGLHVITVTGTPDDDLTPCEVVFYIRPGNGDCTGETDTVRILINPNNSDVFIPQVITPDNNGKNDLWQIQFKNGILPSNYRISLYNEAGARVFEMSPVRSDWDGGGLPDGVYWYILSDLSGTALETGGLTIRRK